MAKSVKEERLRWVLPIINKQMKLCDVAKICPYSERSLKRWKALYLQYGESGLEPKSAELHIQPNETPIRIKEEVISLRKETPCRSIAISAEVERSKLFSLSFYNISKTL